MLADAVKATSNTAGSGAMALVDVAGFIPPGTAFPLNFPFKYSIYTGGDAAPVFREAGIAYMTSATSMTRAKVSATANGSGTLNTSSGQTPTDFAGTAVTVICAPDASSQESMMPTIDKVSSSVDRYVLTAHRNLVVTNVALGALRVYYMPFLLRCGEQISSLVMQMAAAGAAGNVARLGVYACGANGYIGALLATTGDIDCSTSGFKWATLSSQLNLPPGWYYVAIVSNAAISVIAYTNSAANQVGGSPFGFRTGTNLGGATECRTSDIASAVLPPAPSASTNALWTGTSNYPIVAMGLA